MIDRSAINMAMAQIDRQFGKGSIMRLEEEPQDCPAIPTGAPSLDAALGIGGLPKGRIIEIFGPESVGKSTLTLSVIAEAQKNGLACAYIDMEHAFDPKYASNIGINLKELLFSQPNYAEQALDIVEKLVETNELGVIVVDSVTALVPKAELEGSFEDMQMGLQSRLMSKATRKLEVPASKTNTMIIFVNQIREKMTSYGNPETTSGGRALKYAASVRIDLRKIEDLKDSDGEFRGIKVRAKIIKNKVAPPMRMAELDIIFGKGIDSFSSLIDVLVSRGVIKAKGGGYFEYQEKNIARGKDGLVEFLASDLDLLETMKKELYERL